MEAMTANNQTTAKMPPALEAVNMSKRFGSFVALDDVTLKIKPGTVHALLGENGAGKSTLVKCIMGFYQPSGGEVVIDKCSRQIDSPRNAHKYGIGMVYQHFTSIPAMTVAENLVLSRYDKTQLIDWKRESKNLTEFMAASPLKVPLNVPVAQLAAGQKQKLEILKQIYLQSRILILDEPTSVLTPQEADEVLGLLREEVVAGNLSILLISHKFREVMAFCDEVTVLRKGKLAGTGLVRDLNIFDLAQMMMGEKQELEQIEKMETSTGQTVLEIKNICVDRDNGLPAVKGVNLKVNSSEIVGIAGVSGNGQKELVEVLSGQRSATSGEIFVNGETYRATREEMFHHQVFSLPEELLQNACVSNMSVAENMALRTFDRSPQSQKGFLNLKAIRQAAKSLIKTFSVNTPSPETPIANLSGGNVQRAVLARELSSKKIELLIAANPCFGLDFSSVDFIHRSIVKARNRGVAVLLVSEDLDELLKLCDRLVAIREGKLVYEGVAAEADINTIGRRMAGY
ncbi:MAG TPA: ABC transporter ATP-binding protein [Coleofasciculaceae cyanobacterium]|jgi:simple sugar transport system ATP-binding protein